jgi:hypothetical protein
LFSKKSVFDSDGDSAFGSGDPTPSHKTRYAIEFSEDPFQNEVHRYGDPFDISGISIVNTYQFHLTSKLPKMILNVKKI